MSKKISYGDIWLVDLDPEIGHEKAKKRPCVVISADTFNQGPGELAVVLPLTSQYRPLSWLVQIDPPEGGLSKRSYVICNQLRTVSHLRFSDSPMGSIKPENLAQINKRLFFLFQLENINTND